MLLLDEPLSALDEFLRVQMRSELRHMQRELGITFVHVTHTQLEAIALADQVVVMEKGHIEQAVVAARHLCRRRRIPMSRASWAARMCSRARIETLAGEVATLQRRAGQTLRRAGTRRR